MKDAVKLSFLTHLVAQFLVKKDLLSKNEMFSTDEIFC